MINMLLHKVRNGTAGVTGLTLSCVGLCVQGTRGIGNQECQKIMTSLNLCIMEQLNRTSTLKYTWRRLGSLKQHVIN